MNLKPAQEEFVNHWHAVITTSVLNLLPTEEVLLETRTSVHQTIFSVLFTVYLEDQMPNSPLILSSEQVFKRSRKVTYGNI